MRRYSLSVANQTDDRVEIKMVESDSGDYTDFFEAYDTISGLHERIEDLENEIAMLDSLYGGGA